MLTEADFNIHDNLLRLQLEPITDEILAEIQGPDPASTRSWIKKDRLRAQADKLFAASRGWKVSSRAYNMGDIMPRMPRHYIEDHEDRRRPPACDHPSFFKDARGKPVAVLGQPYGFYNAGTRVGDREIAEGVRWCQEVADRKGLSFELLDIPSWWYPGRSIVTLWSRREYAQPIAPFAIERTQYTVRHPSM
jgi:hypothetical protein